MKQNWTYKKLNEVCDKGSSNLVISKLEDNHGEYPLFGAAGIVKGIDFYHQDKPYIGIVKDGAGVGRVNVYPAKSSLVGTMQYIFPKNECLLDYIKYFLIKLDLSKHVSGATIPHIYFKDYGKELIPLPPLSTQQFIVAELDEINNLLSLKRKELDAYDKLAQSLFYEMFGDPVDNEKGWEVKKLGEVCPVVVDGVHSKPNYTSEGKPFVSVVNINKGKLNLTDCKFVSEEDFLLMTKKNKAEKGDILYSKVGATYGIPALVDSDVDFALYVSVCLIKPNHKHINSIFLVEMMRSPFIKYQADRRIRGIGVPDLHLNQIRAFNVILPPLSLQQTFATRIEAIEEQKANVKAAIEKLETLLAARMQYWFE